VIHWKQYRHWMRQLASKTVLEDYPTPPHFRKYVEMSHV